MPGPPSLLSGYDHCPDGPLTCRSSGGTARGQAHCALPGRRARSSCSLPWPEQSSEGRDAPRSAPASTRVRAQGVQGGGQEDDVGAGGPRGGGGGRAPTRSPPACVPPFPRLGWVRRPVGRAYPAPRQALCKSQVFGLQIGQRLGGGRVGLGSGRLGEQKCGNRRRPAT